MPPYQAGDRAEGDGGQVGDGPVQQHGGCHLRAIPVAGAGGQRGDQPEFGDAEAAGGDGQHRQQPDERERRQGGLPRYLGLGQADAAQACQQDQPQGEVARRRGGGDPPAAGGDQDPGPVAEAEQSSGDVEGRRPACYPAGRNERELQRAAGADRERLAAHEKAEPGGQGGEQGQACGGGGDQAGPGRLAVARTSRARTGRPRRAKTFQIPDTRV